MPSCAEAELPNDLDRNTWVLTVVGKGNQIREVPLKNGTVDAVRAWLAHRGQEPGPLLCPVLKGGRIQYRRLSEQAIYNICAKRAEEAGIASYTPPRHEANLHLFVARSGRRYLGRLEAVWSSQRTQHYGEVRSPGRACPACRSRDDHTSLRVSGVGGWGEKWTNEMQANLQTTLSRPITLGPSATRVLHGAASRAGRDGPEDPADEISSRE